MKSAKEWQEELAGETSVESIRLIQADALTHAANLVNQHRQDVFGDGLDADLHVMDKKSIFLESMTQERDSIEDAIRAAAKSLNETL